MRKIKFRVWDKVMKKMYHPQAISFDRQTLVPFAVSVPGRSWEPITKFELMQWTGFSDCNGTDVYEADLVEISSVVYEVFYHETTAIFELIDREGLKNRAIYDIRDGQVIGNKFQKN